MQRLFEINCILAQFQRLDKKRIHVERILLYEPHTRADLELVQQELFEKINPRFARQVTLKLGNNITSTRAASAVKVVHTVR